MTAVKPSRAYRVTFFQTLSTDPQVVSTSAQPRSCSRASSWTVTPNAGMITTSPSPSGVSGSPGSLRNLMPAARSFSLTCGLWMISPVR